MWINADIYSPISELLELGYPQLMKLLISPNKRLKFIFEQKITLNIFLSMLDQICLENYL